MVPEELVAADAEGVEAAVWPSLTLTLSERASIGTARNTRSVASQSRPRFCVSISMTGRPY